MSVSIPCVSVPCPDPKRPHRWLTSAERSARIADVAEVLGRMLLDLSPEAPSHARWSNNLIATRGDE